MANIIPIHPGKMLRVNHMETYDYDIPTLAKKLDIDSKEMELIINEKSRITPDLSVRLGKLFGNDNEFWLRLQKRFESDLEMKRNNISPQKPLLKLFENKQEALLTAMFASGEGVFYGSLWIHKIVFLLDNVIKKKTSKHMFEFKYDDYGITCPSIYDVIRKSQKENCIKIITAKQCDQKHDQYKIEPKGRRIGKYCFNNLPSDVAEYLKKVSEWAHGCSFKDLVNTFYAMYPETRENSKFHSSNSGTNEQLLVFDHISYRRKDLYERITDE